MDTQATFGYYQRDLQPAVNDIALVLERERDTEHISLPVYDLRPQVPDPDPAKSFDERGFTVISQRSAIDDPQHYTRSTWDDGSVVKPIYYGEISEVLRKVTGAKEVLPFGYIVRSELVMQHLSLDKYRKGKQGPSGKVHIDWTAKGARQWVQNQHGEIGKAVREVVVAQVSAAERAGVPFEDWDGSGYTGPRWAMVGTWRPLKVVERDPLGLADWTSIPADDLVPLSRTMDNIPNMNPSFQTENALFRLPKDISQPHRWCYISRQKPEELLIFKFHDSEADRFGSGIAGGVPHGAFTLQGTEDLPPRESVETKCFLLW